MCGAGVGRGGLGSWLVIGNLALGLDRHHIRYVRPGAKY